MLACSSTSLALRLLAQASHEAAFSGCAEQQTAMAAYITEFSNLEKQNFVARILA